MDGALKKLTDALGIAFGFDPNHVALDVRAEPGVMHFDVIDMDETGRPIMDRSPENPNEPFVMHRESFRIEAI